MQSKAKSVDEYLAELPADRRAALETVRAVILKNIDGDYEEGMQYGMIGYYVPHRVFPAGYHCDPRQPLPFAGLASQKNYMSLYMMSLYGAAGNERVEGGSEHEHWFRAAWAKAGKKLDMGKCCIRFEKIDDLALDVVAEAFRRVTVKKYLAFYEKAMKANAERKVKGTAKKQKDISPRTKGRKEPRTK